MDNIQENYSFGHTPLSLSINHMKSMCKGKMKVWGWHGWDKVFLNYILKILIIEKHDSEPTDCQVILHSLGKNVVEA